MNILVIGGGGYVGSHLCLALKQHGFSPTIYDLACSDFLWELLGEPHVILGDVRNFAALENVFEVYRPLAVIHLASFIDVRESSLNPLKYYDNNVAGTISLLKALALHQVRFLLFSSSAAVYGELPSPISEEQILKPINVYGRSKKMVEEIITDFSQAYGTSFIILRYFNVAGADASGRLGEMHEPETHLIPLAIRSLMKQGYPLKIFGNDHPTPDGTPIRDYIHVSDVADAHVRSLRFLLEGGRSSIFNIGSGRGHSVLDVLRQIEFYTSQQIPLEILPRKALDPSSLIADINCIKETLQWEPVHDLGSIVQSALRWHHACEKALL